MELKLHDELLISGQNNISLTKKIMKNLKKWIRENSSLVSHWDIIFNFDCIHLKMIGEYIEKDNMEIFIDELIQFLNECSKYLFEINMSIPYFITHKWYIASGVLYLSSFDKKAFSVEISYNGNILNKNFNWK